MTDTTIEEYEIYKILRNRAQSNIHCRKHQA